MGTPYSAKPDLKNSLWITEVSALGYNNALL